MKPTAHRQPVSSSGIPHATMHLPQGTKSSSSSSSTLSCRCSRAIRKIQDFTTITASLAKQDPAISRHDFDSWPLIDRQLLLLTKGNSEPEGSETWLEARLRARLELQRVYEEIVSGPDLIEVFIFKIFSKNSY